MANNRVFYACQLVAISPTGTNFNAADEVRAVHGVQSVGITTNFNLEQAFELGQIQIYENIEGTPDVEVTLEKVLDGHPLIYHLATPYASSNNLVGRSKAQCNVALGIYPDDQDSVDGDAPVEVFMSGMYLSNVAYNFGTDGNFTESVTFVGNNKQWNTTPLLVTDATSQELPPAAVGAGTDSPISGVQRREDIDLAKCAIPKSVYGVVGSGIGNATDTDGNPIVHIQSFSCSTDLSREDILELGRRTPYFRSPNFPVEVTAELEVISVSGDFIGAVETADSNTDEETIFIKTKDGVEIYLGDKNRLASVTYGGGDAAGGNATQTYSYTTFNDMMVTREDTGFDPAGQTRDARISY